MHVSMYNFIYQHMYIVSSLSLFKSYGNLMKMNFDVRHVVLGQKLAVWHNFTFYRIWYVCMYLSMCLQYIKFKPI